MSKEKLVDWNKYTLDELTSYLENKYMYSSTGDAKAIFELINFYKEHKSKIDLDKLGKDIDNLLKEDLTVYEFCYNDACYECSPLVISIHITKKGAEMALEFHKEKERKEHFIAYGNHSEYKYDYDKSWGVRETKLLK